MKTTRLLVPPIALAIFLCAPGLGFARQDALESPTGNALQSELERLNETMDRIVVLLERSVERQRLELLMQRVELSARRLAQAESDLRSSHLTKISLEEEKLEMQARLSQLAEQLDAGTVDLPPAEIERYGGELGLQLALLNDKIRNIEAEIQVLENRVTAQRNEMEDWQTYVDRELGSP